MTLLENTIMRPPFPRCLAAWLITMKVPRRLVEVSRSNASRLLSAIGPIGMMPALFTTTSIRPNREGVSVGGLDLGHRRFGMGGIAGVVQDDGEAVASQSQGHRAADATRSAGDDGNPCLYISHGSPPGTVGLCLLLLGRDGGHRRHSEHGFPQERDSTNPFTTTAATQTKGSQASRNDDLAWSTAPISAPAP